jgi:hypothetical protein
MRSFISTRHTIDGEGLWRRPRRCVLDEETYETFARTAQAERCSLANLVETAAPRRIEESHFLDDSEMAEILSRAALVKRLRAGSADASKRKGRFVSSRLRILKPGGSGAIWSLQGLPLKDDSKRSFARRLARLIENPYLGPAVKRLENWDPPTWRYRVGDWRSSTRSTSGLEPL